MPLRFTFRQLEYFVAVGETGSVTAAAQAVNVSSPSISAGVAQLEEQLGVKLFARQHAQGLVLTSVGQKLLVHAKNVLAQADEMLDQAGDLSGLVRGPLAIGCLSTFAQIILPGLRQSFVNAHEDVRISQIEDDQSALFSLLRQAKIDVALTYDLNLPNDLTFLPILSLPPLAALCESHPLARQSVISLGDLSPYPMILLDLPHSSDYFMSFFAEAGLRANVIERTRDMAVMRGLVANGFGYSIVNSRPHKDRAPDGKPLRFIPLAGDLRPMKLGILTGAPSGQTQLLKAFMTHAQNWIEHQASELLGVKSPLV